MSNLLGAFLAILAAFFYSIHILLIRKATVSSKPLDAVLATVWITVLVFLPAAFLFYYPNFGLNKVTISVFIISGLLGNLFGYFFYYEGTERVGASRAVPISRASLLVATIFALTVLGEDLTLIHLTGILLLVFGVVIVGREIHSESSKSKWKLELGILFPLGAMICFGLSAPIGKIGLSRGVPVLVGLTIKFSTALLFLISYFVMKNDSPIRPFREENKYLLVGAGLGLTLGNIFLFSALNISDVVIAMPFYSLTPLFVMTFSYLFLEKLENINKILLIGAVLVVAGGILVGASI